MNKGEFIGELQKKLKQLPKEEIVNAVEYYNDYFDDAGLENEQKVIMELGSPAQVASAIIADFAVRNTTVEGEKLENSSISTLKFVLIAIVTAPIELTAAIWLIMMLLIAVSFAASILVACYAIVISFVFGGLFCIVAGLGVFFSHWLRRHSLPE